MVLSLYLGFGSVTIPISLRNSDNNCFRKEQPVRIHSGKLSMRDFCLHKQPPYLLHVYSMLQSLRRSLIYKSLHRISCTLRYIVGIVLALRYRHARYDFHKRDTVIMLRPYSQPFKQPICNQQSNEDNKNPSRFQKFRFTHNLQSLISAPQCEQKLCSIASFIRISVPHTEHFISKPYATSCLSAGIHSPL